MTALYSREERIEKFYSRIEMIPFSDCWLWAGARNQNGYGVVRGFDRKQVLAHRFMYALEIGPIPDGLHVLHTCHKGHLGCVSPHHLYLGTHQDNMGDRTEAGSCKGERHGQARLTEPQVLEIYDLAQAGIYLQREIGAMYGVPRYVVGFINCGKSWSWLTGATS